MKYALLGNAFFRIGVHNRVEISKVIAGGSCGLDEQQTPILNDAFSCARLRQLLQKDRLARIYFFLYEVKLCLFAYFFLLRSSKLCLIRVCENKLCLSSVM